MKLIALKHEELYKNGFLDYALSSLKQQESFDKYAEWLTTQPVMTFTNEDDWQLGYNKIVYTDPETKREEIYEVSLIIWLNNEVILHSLEAGNSWFFKTYQDNKLTALYVD